MTLIDLLKAIYDALHAQSGMIALLFIALPVGGTMLAHMGKGGRTDADGKLIASLVIGAAILLVVVELAALLLAAKLLHRDMMSAALMGDATLVLGPPLSLLACIAGMRLVFPLGQLATIRTLRDAALMVAIGGALLWVLSRFKGWGIWFLGSVGDLAVILCVVVGVLVILYRRSFRS